MEVKELKRQALVWGPWQEQVLSPEHSLGPPGADMLLW